MLENLKNSPSKTKDSLKLFLKDRESTFSCTRKRLIEQALIKDNIPSKNKSIRSASSSDGMSLNFSKFLQPVTRVIQPRKTILKKPTEEKNICKKEPERPSRSKSPACTKIN